MTFFPHISPSLFCHGTAFISYNLRAHLYHPTVFFSLPSANMVLLSFSCFSCLTLHPLPLLATYMPLLIHAHPCLMLTLLFMLVTSFMPLLTSHLSLPSCLLVSLYSCSYFSHTCHFIFDLCSHLPIKLLCYSVGSLYSCSGASH